MAWMVILNIRDQVNTYMHITLECLLVSYALLATAYVFSSEIMSYTNFLPKWHSRGIQVTECNILCPAWSHPSTPSHPLSAKDKLSPLETVSWWRSAMQCDGGIMLPITESTSEPSITISLTPVTMDLSFAEKLNPICLELSWNGTTQTLPKWAASANVLYQRFSTICVFN